MVCGSARARGQENAESAKAPARGKVGVIAFKDGAAVQVTIPFRAVPEGDGRTFEFATTFEETVPPGRPEKWTGRKAGESTDRPADASRIVVHKIQGNAVELGGNRFRIEYNRRGFTGYRSREIVLAAEYPADGESQRFTQQAILRFSRPKAPGGKSHWYVREGPATVDDDGNLTILPLSPRSKSAPITLCEWKWGSDEPRYTTIPHTQAE